MHNDFFITGGTLPPDAHSYIERSADAALLDGLRRGELCYVLNTRQMGKSSLMIRTARQLKADGCCCCMLDLTAIGQNLSVSQWYFGLLGRVGTQLGQEDALFDWWREHRDLGPMQRFIEALRHLVLTMELSHVLLENSPTLPRLVIFIDEIDAVRSLPFSADEFFAGIRECYNRRASDPVFARLTFSLLGVATPSELIQDTRISPFNIGQRIELRDFTSEEAASLAAGFNGPCALRLLQRVLYWTNGHPYLTQRLCRAVAEEMTPKMSAQADGAALLAVVDSQCERLFLSKAAQESDDNLMFVRNRLLRSEADLAALLDVYLQIQRGKRVRDDETNPLCGVLRLSGVTTAQGGLLLSRSRIYDRVFDRDWVLANMPGAEIRRQKRAFQRGMLRAASVFGSLALLGTILLFIAVVSARHAHDAEGRALKQELRANAQAAKAERLLYFSDLRLIQSEWDSSNLEHVQNLLDETQYSPQLGWEWHYWNRLMHRQKKIIPIEGGIAYALFSSNNRLVIQSNKTAPLYVYNLYNTTVNQRPEIGWSNGIPQDCSPGSARLWMIDSDGITIRDVLTGKTILRQSTNLPHFTTVCTLRDGLGLITGSVDGSLRLWDLRTRQCLWHRQAAEKSIIVNIVVSSTLALTLDGHRRPHLYSLPEGTENHAFDTALKMFAPSIKVFSHDGALLAGEGLNGGIVLLDLHTGKIGPALGTDRTLEAVGFGPHDDTLVAAFWGTIRVWDWRTRHERNAFTVSRGRLDFCALSPDGRYAATCSSDTETVWDLSVSPEPRILAISRKSLERLCYSPDGRQVAVGGTDGNVYRCDAGTGRALPILRGDNVGVNMVTFSHNGLWIVGARKDGTLWVWEARTGQRIAAFRAHKKTVEAVCFSHDDQQLITCADDSLVKVWDITLGEGVLENSLWNCKEHLTLRGHDKEVEFATVSPDAAHILTGSDDKTARLWNARTGALQATFPTSHEVWSVAFSPDGERAAFALLNNTTEVWSIAAHRRVLVLQGHTHWVTNVAFSPDGKRIVTGSRDETARIWDANSGRELLTLKGHHGQVDGVAFSPDGKQVATCGVDGTLRLWNASPL